MGILSSCLLGILSFLPLSFYAGTQIYDIRSFSVDEGLSQSMAYCILQDSRGFMWVGTQDGLNRYDGQYFSVFKHNPKDPDTVVSDKFFSIYEDSDSRIWLGTDRGIDIYDPSLEKFTRFSLRCSDGTAVRSCIRHISKDASGNIWIAGDDASLFCFREGSRLEKYDIASYIEKEHISDPAMVSVRCVSADGDILWMATTCGLMSMDLTDGSITHCSPRGSGVREATCIIPYMSDRILVGTASCGVQIYDRSTRSFSDFLRYDPDSRSPLYVRKLLRASDGRIWIGTESGAYVYNTRDKSVSNFRHICGNPYSLSDNAVHSIAEDRDGGIWIGTYFGGINYFSTSCPFEKYFPVPGENSVSGRCVSEFCQDGSGTIWIATEDAGLDRFNPKTGKFAHVNLPVTNIHALMTYGNELWVGTFSGGLYVIDVRTGARKVYSSSADGKSLASNDVYSIFRDSDGTVWVGTSAGLNRYDRKNDAFEAVCPEMISRQVNDICEDWFGNIWIAVLGGESITMTEATADGRTTVPPMMNPYSGQSA